MDAGARPWTESNTTKTPPVEPYEARARGQHRASRDDEAGKERLVLGVLDDEATGGKRKG